MTDSPQAARRAPSRLAVAAILVLLGVIIVLLLVLLNRSGTPGGVQPRAQAPTVTVTVTDYDGPGSDPTVTVVVKPGMNFHDIGNLLQGSGVVLTEAAFVDAANKNQESITLQAGSYALHTRMKASLALAAMLSQKPGRG